jgi:3-oxoacyl-[acyl-carrier protein] reductase
MDHPVNNVRRKTLSNEAKQKIALVFGGSRGIGAASAERLAQDGYHVALTYVSRPDKAEEQVAKILKHGGQAVAIKADSSNASDITAAVKQTVEHFGKIDTVVVNAGVFKTGLIEDVSIEDLDQLISINIRGVFLSIQATVPHVNDGGRIITIGSNTALHTGDTGISVYQFTKAAVASMVKGIALDLAPRKITVNNVQPGPVATDIHNAESVAALSQRSPLKRVGTSEEIARLVSYLASEDSSYMTGASLTIDGGYTL